MNELQPAEQMTSAEQPIPAEQPTLQMQLFEDNMYVELPMSTAPMPEDMIHRLYSSSDRPQLFFYREEGPLYFTFSLHDNAIENKEVFIAINNMKNVVEAAYPQSIIGHVNLLKYTHNYCGWFAFKSPSVDQERYNIMYITPVKGRLMLGTCSCPMGDEDGMLQIKRAFLSVKEITTARR